MAPMRRAKPFRQERARRPSWHRGNLARTRFANGEKNICCIDYAAAGLTEVFFGPGDSGEAGSGGGNSPREVRRMVRTNAKKRSTEITHQKEPKPARKPTSSTSPFAAIV